MEKFKNFELIKPKEILGGRRDRYYYDTDGDGRWDVKVVNVYKKNGLGCWYLSRVIQKFR